MNYKEGRALWVAEEVVDYLNAKNEKLVCYVCTNVPKEKKIIFEKLIGQGVSFTKSWSYDSLQIDRIKEISVIGEELWIDFNEMEGKKVV